MISADAIVGELDNVSVAYHGDINVLQDLSVQFRANAVTGIIGPNGAGKSTVLKTFFGNLKPRSGDIRVGKHSTLTVPPHAMAGLGVAYVPQNRSLFLDLSVEDNLMLGCWTFLKDKARTRRCLDRAYEQFPALAEVRGESAGRMSGGQRRFLEIARALLLDPKILLLDEPTAMIAPKIAAEIYERIRDLSRQGIAVVLVDQNIKPCVAISDWIIVLQLGRKTAECAGSELDGDTGMRRLIGSWLEVQGG